MGEITPEILLKGATADYAINIGNLFISILQTL